MIIQPDFIKSYHQQDSRLNDPIQGTDFFSGEKIYLLVDYGYLDFEITFGKDGEKCNNFTDGYVDELIRMVNFAFAHSFFITTLSTTGGIESEQNKYVE